MKPMRHLPQDQERYVSMRLGILLFTVCTVLGVRPVVAQDYLDGFSEWLEQARQAWTMPGLSVAIVDGDDIVFAEGFGVLEQGKPAEVDADTLFAIGSNTKMFTAAALGTLVDENKLDWDDKVVERLDGFLLADPYRTGELTLRDALSHRAGYATWTGDLLWWGSDITREESVARLRYLEPAFALRTQWGYSNFMFLVAGEITEQATGKQWETVIEERLLQPLGLKRTFARFSDVERQDNLATPHSMVDDEHVPIPHRDITNIGPAGSIYSSASDMAKWLLMRVHDGELEGRRIVSEATMTALRTPNTIMPGLHRAGSPQGSSLYGLGVMATSYRGEYMTLHGGGIDGMISQVAALPDRDFGVVVLTNSDEWGGLASMVVYEAFDRFLGIEDRSWAYAGSEAATDWSEFGLEQTRAGKAAQAQAEAAKVQTRLAGTRPSLPLEAYTGTYHDDFLGDVLVELEQGQLVLKLPRHAELRAPLSHWHLDIFEADWDAAAARESMVDFDLDASGRVSSLSFQIRPDFLDPLTYEFRRVEGDSN
jgi:CubicO group peptidase (beta-lactamase class C family)